MKGKGSVVGGSFPNRLRPPLLFPPPHRNEFRTLCGLNLPLFPHLLIGSSSAEPFLFFPAINIHHSLAVHTERAILL